MMRGRGFGLAGGMAARVAALWLSAVVLATVFAAPLGAQETEAQVRQDGQHEKIPTLHAYSNLVQIPTLVLDENREPMAPVAERRFFVSLDGGPRFRVTHARLEGDDPISLAIVMDVSQPFPTLMKKMDEAVGGLAPLSLKAADHVSVYSIDCALIRSANDVPADSARLERSVDAALQPWRTRGRLRWGKACKRPSNLWDSLAVVTEALAEHPGRRVILVVTDGVDRGSRTSPVALRKVATSNGVAIFGLAEFSALTAGFRPPGAEGTFNTLCELSGGMVLTTEGKEVARQLQWFIKMLRGRYIVEFPHPLDSAGGEHGMDITIEKADAFIRPAGISIPADDPAILNDPNTVPQNPEDAPQLGKQKVLLPH